VSEGLSCSKNSCMAFGAFATLKCGALQARHTTHGTAPEKQGPSF
jgi:hypothetical protein